MSDFLILFSIVSGLNESFGESVVEFSSNGGLDLSKGVLILVLLGSDVFSDGLNSSFIGILLVLLLVELSLSLLNVSLEFVEFVNAIGNSEVFLNFVSGGE